VQSATPPTPAVCHHALSHLDEPRQVGRRVVRRDTVGAVTQQVTWLPLLNKLTPRSQASNVRPSGDLGGPALGTPYVSSVVGFTSFIGAPCQQPPWGHMTAIDLVKRQIIWRKPLGTVAARMPISLGILNLGGSVVTAGGVVFVGASADRTLRAFNAATGAELWHDILPANADATPMTYRGADGRQYVAVAAGGHAGLGSTSDALVAYALPPAGAGATPK
jgi:quinoprotein glucose dehydrogenase